MRITAKFLTFTVCVMTIISLFYLVGVWDLSSGTEDDKQSVEETTTEVTTETHAHTTDVAIEQTSSTAATTDVETTEEESYEDSDYDDSYEDYYDDPEDSDMETAAMKDAKGSYTSEFIAKQLDTYMVTSTEGYHYYHNGDFVKVFGDQETDCLSLSCLPDYNLWGCNVQGMKFNMKHLDITKLGFDVGGEGQSKGKVRLTIYLDKNPDDDVDPDYTYDIEASNEPKHISVNLKNTNSMYVQVSNNNGNNNEIVFFNFADEGGK